MKKPLKKFTLIFLRFLTTTVSLNAVASIESPAEWHGALAHQLVIAHVYKKDEALKKNKVLYQRYKTISTLFKSCQAYVPEVLFIKINISRPHLTWVGQTYKITDPSTFLLFKNNRHVATMRLPLSKAIPSVANLINFLYRYVGEDIKKIRKEMQRLMKLRAQARAAYYYTYPMYYPFYFGPYYYPYRWGHRYHYRRYPYHPYYPYYYNRRPGFYIGVKF